MQSHVTTNKKKACSTVLIQLKKPAVSVSLPTLATIFQWSWPCWCGGVGTGEEQKGKPREFPSADASCFLSLPRWRGPEKTGRTRVEKRSTKTSCGQFLSQGSLAWQQMAYPWRTGSQKAAAPRSWSNSWGHRTSLHKLNARNQWVPLCLHAWTLVSRLLPYACLEQRTGKNNTTHFERQHLQINGKIQYYKVQFPLNYLDFARKLLRH